MNTRSSARRTLLLFIALLLSALLAPAAASARTVELSCQRVPELLRAYLQKHINFHYLNDELRSRAVTSYVKRIDPSKTLLLDSEAEALRKRLMGIFHDVGNGDCTLLDELHGDIVKRYEAMERVVTEFVRREDYALDPSVTLIIDPDKRGHPKTDAHRNLLIHKLVHFQMSNYLGNEMELPEAKEKLVHRYELVTKRAQELDDQDVYSSFLDAFASSLDPHSSYLSAEVLEDFQIGMGLSLEGIGVALSSRDGYSVVEKIIPGGAAASMNVLEPKDKIIAVAQDEGEYIDIIDMNLRDVVRLIRGKRGTRVRLTVLRQGDETERFSVTIVRDKIDLEEQAAKMRVEKVVVGDRELKLAVLDLPSFYGGRSPSERQSSRDVLELLDSAKAAKVDGLLLDLSRNGGGLLDRSVEIAGFFIGEGGVVAVKDTFSKVQELRDPDDGVIFDLPMVVLTSRISASASEIVAGAMKDYSRAVVVGDDHTFGKGTVQSMVPLPEGLGALKVTTALFFRPGGDSTQHAGVASDIVLPSVLSTDDFGEKHQDYSLPAQQIPSFIDRRANPSPESKGYWSPVTQPLVDELSRRSAERVSASEDFAKIAEKIEKAAKREGVVHLAEILEENKKADAEAEAEEAEDAKSAENGENGDDGESAETETAEADTTPPPTPQQREALQILADLVVLMGNTDFLVAQTPTDS